MHCLAAPAPKNKKYIFLNYFWFICDLNFLFFILGALLCDLNNPQLHCNAGHPIWWEFDETKVFMYIVDETHISTSWYTIRHQSEVDNNVYISPPIYKLFPFGTIKWSSRLVEHNFYSENFSPFTQEVFNFQWQALLGKSNSRRKFAELLRKRNVQNLRAQTRKYQGKSQFTSRVPTHFLLQQ
jgi:hypothetical protein